MDSILSEVVKRLDRDSELVLTDTISEAVGKIRVFSYGSNMNEEEFKKEMKRHGYELGLKRAKKRTLSGYRRSLDNESGSHGIAFSIHRYESGHVEGICHDIPIEALGAFLSKEGLFSWRPNYKLIKVKVEQEPKGILSLVGLKRTTIRELTDNDKEKALKYVQATILGAKRWKVNDSYMKRLKKQLSSDKSR
jgi:cation transport regulator ChaC